MPNAATVAYTNVRGVEADLWQALRVEAVKRRLSIGSLLNEIIRDWLEREAHP